MYDLHPGGLRHAVSVSARDTHNGIAGVAFSPDGERIMTGDWGIASVKVWDVSERAGAEWANVLSVQYALGSGSFLPDGRTIVATEPDGHAALWDVETGRRRLRISLDGPGCPLRLAPSPDGTLLAAVAEQRRRAVRSRVRRPGRHPRGPRAVGADWVVWSPDSERLAILGGGVHDDDDSRGVAAIFDRGGTQLARLVEEPQTFFHSVAFVDDGQRLAVSTRAASSGPRLDRPAGVGLGRGGGGRRVPGLAR